MMTSPRSPLRLCIEALERRDAPSATTDGPQFPVNTTTAGPQQTFFENVGAVATDDKGNFVVTWASFGQDGSDMGVVARLFAPDGTPRTGEFVVNTFTPGAQVYPAVAMAADGRFVVAWSGPGEDDDGIFARRFDAAGNALGGDFRVNTTTAGVQRTPTAAADDGGNFVVAWEGASPPDADVFYQRFDSAGTKQGGELTANGPTSGAQYSPVAAMDAAGEFVVTWTYQVNPFTAPDVYARRFAASGSPQGGEFLVHAASTKGQFNSSVAADDSGDFVVTWVDDSLDGNFSGVYAQRYNESGVAQGSAFRVNTTTADHQAMPDVALDADGDFVVTWVSKNQAGPLAVYSQQFTAAGAKDGGEVRVDSGGGDAQFASVAADPGGNFVAVWSAGDGSGSGVFGQRFTRTGVVGVRANDGPAFIAPGATVTGPVDSLAVAFTRNMRADGGPGGVFNLANWAVDVAAGDSATINNISYGFNQTLGRYEAVLALSAPVNAGRYTLRAESTLEDDGGQPLGADYTLGFSVGSVGPVGGPFRVNATKAGEQSLSSVGADAKGNFVVAWASDGQDGSGFGVYAQRYSATGQAAGGEFRVNTTTASEQNSPSVAVAPGGGFVVAWSSLALDGTTWNVRAQRYNASGVAQGGEISVNTTTAGDQVEPDVAIDADGDFVVAWHGAGDGDAAGVFAQRFTAAGAKVGGEFRANTPTSFEQKSPSVAVDAQGNFAVVWTSLSQDSGGLGVYGQRFAADGTPVGAEFRANTATANDQKYPSVTMHADGGFVVAWSTVSADGTAADVFAQMFTAAGAKLGGELAVNTTTAGPQLDPDVAATEGGFVVAWASSTGGPYRIDGQRFDAAGFKAGEEFTATPANSNSALPAVAGAGAGFVVNWSNLDSDGSLSNVYAQRFGVDVPTISGGVPDVSVAEDAANTVIALGSHFTAAGGATLSYQLLDNTNPALFTSVSLAGGTLTLDYAPNASGVADITVRVNASDGDTLDDTFRVTVAPGNDPPALADPGNRTFDELTKLAFNLSGSDPDPGDPLTYSIASGAKAGMLLDAKSGAFEWMPSEAQDGAHSVTFRVTDFAGKTADRTVTLTVREANVAPQIADPGDWVLSESSPFTLDVDGTDADVIAGAPDKLTYSISAGLVTGMSINASTGVFGWTPSGAQNGAFAVTFRVTDGKGLSASKSVTLTVSNEAPTTGLVAPAAGVTSQPLSFTLLATDPSPQDQAAGFTFLIDWDGNGTTDQSVVGPSGTKVAHAFLTVGEHTVRVSARDRDGGVGASVSRAVDVTHTLLADDPLRAGRTALFVGGTAAADAITLRAASGFSPTTGQSVTAAVVSGGQTLASGTFRPTGGVYAFGGAGADSVRLLPAAGGTAVALPSQLDGGTEADTLVGGNGSDTLTGGAGDDVLTGGFGNDRLDGGAGNDLLSESRDAGFTLANNSLTGVGFDALIAVERASLLGGAGNNSFTVSGWTGSATLNGGAGTDRVVASNFSGFTLSDTRLTRTTGGTFALLSIQEAALTGGAGADVINALAFRGRTTLDGGAGNDTLYGGSNADLLRGGDGNDRLSAGVGNDTLSGGNGNDLAYGGAGNDTLLGDAGNDTLSGDAGNDILRGGIGTDSALAGDGNDSLLGESGIDTLNGGAGNDTLSGGIDGLADYLIGGLNGDLFVGEFYTVGGVRKNRDAPKDLGSGDRVV